MTPDKINQLRILLKTIAAIAENDEPDENHGYPKIRNIANQAIALFPCPTCNGAGKIIVSGCYDMVYKEIDCPDCSKPLKLDIEELKSK